MIDLISGVDLTSERIVKEVTSECPVFIKIKDQNVEYAKGFPNMMDTIWGYIVTFHRFPRQQEFVDYFMNVHRASLRGLSVEGVTARVFRSYPSLTRDIHLYSLINESDWFPNVDYSLAVDVGSGIDLQITVADQIYNVSCYVKTARSQDFREKKQCFRHELVKNSMDLVLELEKSEMINNWSFYNHKHCQDLAMRILNHAWSNYGIHPIDHFI